jgi:hypothetical protein
MDAPILGEEPGIVEDPALGVHGDQVPDVADEQPFRGVG